MVQLVFASTRPHYIKFLRRAALRQRRSRQLHPVADKKKISNYSSFFSRSSGTVLTDRTPVLIISRLRFSQRITQSKTTQSPTQSPLWLRERKLCPWDRGLQCGFWKGLRISNKESFYYVDINHNNTGFRFTSSSIKPYITVWF